MAIHPTLLLLFLSAAFASIPNASSATCPKSKKRLIILGDSLLDTGNSQRPYGPWAPPWGASVPKPTGRFSDGLVLTDYLAKFMGIDTPTPIVDVDLMNSTTTRSGVNIAYGGAGLYASPHIAMSMRFQMNSLRQLIDKGVFTYCDLQNSLAFISISGNDYGVYLSYAFPSEKNVTAYTFVLVPQLAANLQMLHLMGIGKVAVALLPPLGCLPDNAADSDYPGNCNQTINEGTRLHNNALKAAVNKLNKANRGTNIAYVDFYKGFSAAMEEHARNATKEYANPTKQCCGGKEVRCGVLDKDGKPMYKMCAEPLKSFFFDGVHPAQHGCEMVINALRDDLRRILA